MRKLLCPFRDMGKRTFRRHGGVHPSGETVGNRYICRLIEFTVQIENHP